MKNFLGWLIVSVALGLVVVGFFRGWFALSTTRDGATNKVNIQLQVDPDQIKIDTDKAKDKASELLDKKEPEPESPAAELETRP